MIQPRTLTRFLQSRHASAKLQGLAFQSLVVLGAALFVGVQRQLKEFLGTELQPPALVPPDLLQGHACGLPEIHRDPR